MNYIEHLFVNFTYQIKADFNSFYSTLAKEITNLKNSYQLNIRTVYIATDDFLLLTDQQLIALLDLIKQFSNENLIEYSFEIGYQTLNQDQIVILRKFNVTRLVWKVRTFNNKLLLNLNQKFNIELIKKLIKVSFNFGFKNFSIDLEDNINNQTTADIINDLKIALAFKAPHISYQSHNDFYNYENKKMIFEFLEQNNYQNYEFFSFALSQEHYSKQTLAYLTLKNWYGLGPNSNSFLKLNHEIFNLVNSSNVPWDSEKIILDTFSYYELLVTQNLMVRSGFLLEKDLLLAAKTFWPQIIALITKGYLQLENNYLRTTNQGWRLLNDVLIDIISSK